MADTINTTDNIPRWLKKYQRLSWEPEILISGGMIFTLLQAPDLIFYIKDFAQRFHMAGTIQTVMVLSVGVAGLTTGFLLHLFLKAFWVSLIAFKFVFPKGINYERLNYDKAFVERIKRQSNLDEQITFIGKSAGLVFSISFGSFLLFIGITCYMIFLFFLANGLDYLGLPNGLILIGIIPAVFLLIDFVTLGILKRYEFISRLYSPLYSFFTPITLSFLYRNLYYTIISNVRRWKLLLFTLAFLMVTSVFSYRIISKSTYLDTYIHGHNFFNDYSPTLESSNYLDELKEGEKVVYGAIQSYVVTENYLRLFIRYSNHLDNTLGYLNEWKEVGREKQIESMSTFFNITIGDRSIDNPKWMFYIHPETEQLGWLGIISIKNLTPGDHSLTVYWDGHEEYLSIPFWKE